MAVVFYYFEPAIEPLTNSMSKGLDYYSNFSASFLLKKDALNDALKLCEPAHVLSSPVN
jgi:hypothetical protein